MTTVTITHRRTTDSTIIDDVQYFPEEERLIVSFKGGSNRYEYPDITQDFFDNMLAAPSLGGYLTLHLFVNGKNKARTIK